ncbi:MAG: hypothetical protein NC541_06440 [bacterium]|nr:hypothetical protein [bacterium]
MRERVKRNKMDSGRIICVLTAAVTLFPVSCGYIMSGGIAAEWVARIQELAQGMQNGSLCFFPGAEPLLAVGITENAADSNLWFLLPGILYAVTDNMLLSYRIFMLLLQAATLMSAVLCFRRIFAQEAPAGICVGVVLYLTNPYRIYICYDRADLSQAAAWMLLPLYVWAVFGLLTSEKKRFRDLTVAALALAGIGYADTVFFLILAGCTLAAGAFRRKMLLWAGVAAGSVIFLPGFCRLTQFLFEGEVYFLGVTAQPLMQKGYRLGQYFSCFAFRGQKPGLGLGMLICLMAVCWLGIVQREKAFQKPSGGFAAFAAFLVLLSHAWFPWDLLNRLGVWAIGLAHLINTPEVFFGMSFAAFSVPAASCVQRLAGREERAAQFLPAAVILACVGICIYQCNMLTLTGQPLY